MLPNVGETNYKNNTTDDKNTKMSQKMEFLSTYAGVINKHFIIPIVSTANNSFAVKPNTPDKLLVTFKNSQTSTAFDIP
jgi:hypothetical protein